MKVVLLRVAIDTGSGGIHGPLFPDGSFEYVPIPDGFGIDERTYGNTIGRCGKRLVEYFPPARHARMSSQSIHFDPEFATYTYGDPSVPKGTLRYLEPGDMLIFYCGLQGWGFDSDPALYLLGYFEVQAAARAIEFSRVQLDSLFGENFHVRHPEVFASQRERLVLVKGGPGSRLLTRAVRISDVGRTYSGKPLKVLSSEMQAIFGGFDGRIGIQRSSLRWVHPDSVERAAELLRSIE